MERFKPRRSVSELRKKFGYDPETGVTWRISTDRIVKLHPRDIWKIHSGKDPGQKIVDHKNRIKSDVRWKNLRLLTKTGNNVNGPINKYNQSGYRGITKTIHGWLASTCVRGRRINLGYYRSKKKAHEAYVRGVEKYHGLKLTEAQLRA